MKEKFQKNSFLLVSICLFVFFISVGILIFELIKPLDLCVTVSGVQTRSQSPNNSRILAQINEAYYETSPSDEFAALFSFNEWVHSEAPSGEPLLSLEFSELWVVEFYADGQTAVYNGYAPIGKKSYAYYDIPEYAVNQIIDYLKRNGVQHVIGDGTIAMGSFNH